MSQFVTNDARTVTDCDQTSRAVTASHTPSHDVTLRTEQNRSEENRSDSCVPFEPSQPALPLQPQQAAESKQPKATRRAGTYTALATALLGELSAARMRVNPKNRIFPPSPAHLRELERCLREGLTVEQLRNVILVWEAMVKAGKQDPEHFDSVTPFRASNVAKYTEKSLEEAAKPRGGVSGTYPGRPAPQEPPRSPVAVENDFQRSLREAREKGEIT